MTTDIKIRVNGAYVVEGTIGIGDQPIRSVKIGPGLPEAVEQSFNVPHGSPVNLSVDERQATEDEVDVAMGRTPKSEGGGPRGHYEGGEFVQD